MIVQRFLSVFLFVLYYLPMRYCDTKPLATSGPFKSSVVSINECRDPSRPYAKNPPIIFNPLIQKIDGRNMLGGNFTITKDSKDVKYKIRLYNWRDGKWSQSLGFNNIDCHSVLLRFTFAACNIKYDKNSCVMFKAFYPLKNMDMNQLQHIWVPTMPYGRLMWRSEIFSRGATYVCKEFEMVSEPAN